MIESLQKIDDIIITQLNWINSNREINTLLEKKIEFTNGVNIIVGKNGTGKTTIINLLRLFTLTDDWFVPKLNPSLIGDRLKESKIPINSFEIKANWNLPTYNLYRMKKDYKAMNSQDTLFSKESITTRLYCLEESDGQNQVADFNMLMREAFQKEIPKNPYELIKSFNKDSELLKFYDDNMINKSNYTILLDEPDAGLDIDNLLDIYDFLQFMATSRDDTQVISSIHNPLIIYKLSQIPEVNFIELTKGYVEKIKSFVAC